MHRDFRPNVNKVALFASAEAGRDWKRIRQQLDCAIRERDANVEA